MLLRKYLLLEISLATTFNLVFSINTSCAEPYPFYINNQNPFIQIFGLPRAEPAKITKQNHYVSMTTLDIVNNTVQGETATEKLVLDGETYRFNMAFRYGFREDSEIGIDIPLIKHRQGRFDNFIRNWHDFFGLSNKEQKQFPPNQLDYYYRYNSTTFINMQDSQSGLGDIRLSMALTDVQVAPFMPRSLVYRAVVKLPTGDSDKLLGSGAFDAALSMALQNDQTLKEYYSAFSGQMGVMWLGKSDHFSDLQRPFVMFLSGTIDWDYWQPLVFKAQLDYHSSMYKSTIGHIGKSSTQLTVGGAINIDKDMHFDIGVSENLITDATPDIGLNLTLWINL